MHRYTTFRSEGSFLVQPSGTWIVKDVLKRSKWKFNQEEKMWIISESIYTKTIDYNEKHRLLLISVTTITKNVNYY